MEIDRGLSPKLARRSIPIRRTHDFPAGKGTTATCRLPLGPGFERIEAPRDNSVFCQCALVSYSLNDKQRSDNLSKSVSDSLSEDCVAGMHRPEFERGWRRRSGHHGIRQPTVQELTTN